jgi:hypothetical protein
MLTSLDLLASHVLRYKSDLSRLSRIIQELLGHLNAMVPDDDEAGRIRAGEEIRGRDDQARSHTRRAGAPLPEAI